MPRIESEETRRAQIVSTMRRMEARGLNRGTTGNVSVRHEKGMLITPSGITADQLTADQIVFLDARQGRAAAALAPSSEWQMHAALLAARPDVNAVVHCHSRFATILACAGKPIPPLHYMVGVAGRPDIPLAPYATFGSAALAANIAATLQTGFACLMANHGQIVAAPGLSRALMIAEEVEEQAAVYWGTLAIGGPNILSDADMADNFRQFGLYGQKR
jgi:L-fuculose-phosphate aldolase